jgi:hypothetical protein
MTKTAKTKPSEQIKAFRKAARKLGCDDNDDRFKEALRTVAKHRPKSKSASVRGRER